MAQDRTTLLLMRKSWTDQSTRFCPVALRGHCANRNLRGAVQSYKASFSGLLRYFSSNQKTAPRDMSGSVNTVLSPEVLP